MHDPTTWFLLLFSTVTALLMAAAVPMMRGWVRPNPLYGVRTAKTLGDEDAWYRSNAHGGRVLFRTGFCQLLAVLALYCVPGLRADFVAYNLACGAVILGGLLLAGLSILRETRSR